MHLDFPPVPYCGALNQQLQPGAVILAKGQSHPGSNYFAIALQCGSSTNFTDDIALYLSVAFTPPPRVIRNSLIQNQWGPEESFGGFPTAPGQPFEIMILVDPAEYRIAFNGQHFTEYRHRIPFQNVTHVSLSGDVRFDSFSIWYSQDSGYSTQAPAPGLYPNLATESPGPATGYYPSNVGSPPYPTNTGPYPPPPGYGPSPPYDPSQTGGYNAHPPNPSSSSGGGGIGSMLGGALTGVAGGLATNAITSKIFGRKHHYGPSSMIPGIVSGVAGSAMGGGHHHKPHKHKKSSGIPIAGLAAGAGAAALGAALLSNPLKKAFKHKHKGSWSHKGWGGRSSSSSSSEEE